MFRLTYCTKKGKNSILKPYKLKIGTNVTAGSNNKFDCDFESNALIAISNIK